MRPLRAVLWKVLRWFLFRIDAETAHRFSCAMMRLGIALGGAPLRIASGTPARTLRDAGVEVLGMRFRSRVGLAAGFDKDAEVLRALPDLGFGFAEIGTVTPRPQPGNPRPRLFREPARQAVFNRMGFNNLGASVVSERLRAARSLLPENFRVGVNVGKNKDTALADAADDYRKAAAAFEGLADYLVINVSSPNTPGLRSLQAVEALKPIVQEVGNVIGAWRARPPLLLKIAPEIRGLELAQLIQSAENWGIDGWVLANTLAGERDKLSGGWSGGPLAEDSLRCLLEVRKLTNKPVISVGGILSKEEAAARISSGADLVQLYTGWIYGGPAFPTQVARFLARGH